MSSYLKTFQLKSITEASEASSTRLWTLLGESASRYLDELCEVDDDYFGQSPSDATTKTYESNGIRLMRIHPIIKDSVTKIEQVNEDGTRKEFTADQYKITADNKIAFWLKRVPKADFDDDVEIEITARFGFEKVPPKIQMVTREIAVYCWHFLDPKDIRNADIDVAVFEKGLSTMTWSIIKKIKNRVSMAHL